MLRCCLFKVDELLALVDELLRRRNGFQLKHDIQWNALCRAYELRSTSGDSLQLYANVNIGKYNTK